MASSGSPPRLSVVVPTCNRRERLAKALDALGRQSLDPESFEVVVVDDGSSDGTDRLLADYGSRLRLSALRQENRGPAAARNAGVGLARAELVLFLDDDVVALPQLLEEHLKTHACHPGSAVIGPQLSLDRYAEPWTGWNQRKLERQYRAMERGDFEPSFRQFWTGNASVARAAVLRAGGFDPGLRRAEDIELGYRLSRQGTRFRFNPRAGGVHCAARPLEAWEQAHASYGALEVEIFGRAGEAVLFEILADNWRGLRPATRWLLRRCAEHPERARGLRRLLRSTIGAARRMPAAPAVQAACSVLANLAYWSESWTALGADRRRRWLERVAD